MAQAVSSRSLTSVHVRFVVDKVALGQVFVPVLRLSPFSIIPALLHFLFGLSITLIRRTIGPIIVHKALCLIPGGSSA